MHPPAPDLWFTTSRAAGIAMLLLSSAGLSAGLLSGTRFADGRGPQLRTIHEALSLAVLVALVAHVGGLRGASFFKGSILDVTVPFLAKGKGPWTGIGIIAAWAMIALGVSYYARGVIGYQRWRILHRLTVLASGAGIVHALGQGADASTWWFYTGLAIVAVPAFGLLVRRSLLAASRPLLGRTSS